MSYIIINPLIIFFLIFHYKPTYSCFKPQPENSPYVSNKSEMNSEKCVPMTLIGTKTESPEGVTTSLTIRGSQNQLQVKNDLEKGF